MGCKGSSVHYAPLSSLWQHEAQIRDAEDTLLLVYFLSPLGAVLSWSGNMTFNQLSVGSIAPSSIAFLRWVLARVGVSVLLALGGMLVA